MEFNPCTQDFVDSRNLACNNISDISQKIVKIGGQKWSQNKVKMIKIGGQHDQNWWST